MKYLNDYIEKGTDAVYNKHNVFYAFNDEQLQEGTSKSPEGTKFVSMGMGLICPKENVKQFIEDYDDVLQAGIKQDIKENGIKAIIMRELANHECQISMDISDCVNKLSEYPITEADIQSHWKEYFQQCIDNDWF